MVALSIFFKLTCYFIGILGKQGYATNLFFTIDLA